MSAKTFFVAARHGDFAFARSLERFEYLDAKYNRVAFRQDAFPRVEVGLYVFILGDFVVLGLLVSLLGRLLGVLLLIVWPSVFAAYALGAHLLHEPLYQRARIFVFESLRLPRVIIHEQTADIIVGVLCDAYKVLVCACRCVGSAGADYALTFHCGHH